MRKATQAEGDGLLSFAFRHRVDELVVDGGTVTGVRGTELAPATESRGRPTNRDVVRDFELTAPAVVVTSGGIGGDHDLVRQAWPERLGSAPDHLTAGVPAYVDGRIIGIVEGAGGTVINRDRMWHYVEGIHNWAPVWPGHAIRILPGPSSMWFDGNGHRLPAPYFPGFDTLGTLAHLRATGHDHSWFVLTQKVIEKEFALSGSEQNPDLTGKSVRQVLGRVRPGAPKPVQDFVDHGEDFVTATTIQGLVERMNSLTPDAPLDADDIERQVAERDRELDNAFAKDAQVTAIHGARRYRGDRLIRTAAPHKFLDPANGPLIAVRLSVVTRKTFGGLQTDLSSRVLRADGEPFPGLYAAGEVAGFGGGGMHGYRSLEGTFLGGCLFSGRTAGRAVRRRSTDVLPMAVTNRPRRIILVRHGESQGNVDDAIYETVPDHALTLTPKGLEQATEAGRRLREYFGSEPVTVYASPYIRTRQTVYALGLGIPSGDVRIEPRLREQDWANFQDPPTSPSRSGSATSTATSTTGSPTASPGRTSTTASARSSSRCGATSRPIPPDRTAIRCGPEPRHRHPRPHHAAVLHAVVPLERRVLRVAGEPRERWLRRIGAPTGPEVRLEEPFVQWNQAYVATERERSSWR